MLIAMSCQRLIIHARKKSAHFILGVFLLVAPISLLADQESRAQHLARSEVGPRGQQYEQAAAKFFGIKPTDEFWHEAPLSTQIASALSIEDRTRPLYPFRGGIGDRMILVTGCRIHSCDDKAAIVLDGAGNIIAGATISRKCFSQCSPTPILSIYRIGNTMPEHIEDALVGWARAKVPLIEEIRRIDLSK